MLGFLKYVFATLFGILLFFVLLVALIVVVGTSATKKHTDNEVKNSILKLEFNKPILERERENPFEDWNIPYAGESSGLGLIEIRQALEKAATDPNIKGVYMEMNLLQAGSATVEELRNALLAFRTSGKFVYSYSEAYSEKAYYLASASDKIFLNPVGFLEFNGLSYRSLFYKPLLDKLELKPEVYRVGEFKSAVEPFLQDKMSDANRKQTQSFLESFTAHYYGQIALSRNIRLERLQVIADSMLVRKAENAVALGLVDSLFYYDQVEKSLYNASGTPSGQKLSFIPYSKYAEDEPDEDPPVTTDHIAVVIANGDIMQGAGDEETIGSDKLAAELRKLRKDKHVKAVVLRINSPGGSVIASDVIWREADLVSKVKPIVASMSDLAASGGYYIAAPCTKIVAQPTTLTGSIGVFGLLLNAKDFLSNKLGITSDVVNTGLFSDVESPFRARTSYEKAVIQQEVENTYADFTSKVAKGRKLPLSKVKEIAQGRVWSGIQAKNIGLVDTLGGLETAIAMAAGLSKMKMGHQTRYYPAKRNIIERMFSGFQEETTAKTLKSQLGSLYPIFASFKKISVMQGVQARLPYIVEIE